MRSTRMSCNPYLAEPETQDELDEAWEEANWLASLFASEPPMCWWPVDYSTTCATSRSSDRLPRRAIGCCISATHPEHRD